jgi:hypothetical protein
MKNGKTLMFQMTNAMPKSEAYSFAGTIPKINGDKFYIYKISENPKARDAWRRESWVIVRPVRTGEVVSNGYAIWVDKLHLIYVNGEQPK